LADALNAVRLGDLERFNSGRDYTLQGCHDLISDEVGAKLLGVNIWIVITPLGRCFARSVKLLDRR